MWGIKVRFYTKVPEYKFLTELSTFFAHPSTGSGTAVHKKKSGRKRPDCFGAEGLLSLAKLHPARLLQELTYSLNSGSGPT